MLSYLQSIHVLLLGGQTGDIHRAELLQECAELVPVQPAEVEGGQVLACAVGGAFGVVLGYGQRTA